MSDSPICIVGMHRSGTSMVAQLLARSGVFLGPPEELMPATADNQEGYWEDQRLVKVAEDILRLFGGSWDAPPVFEEGWTADPRLDPIKAAARQALEVNEQHRPWAWKDPRTCLLLEFWRELIPDLRLVVCARHPASVIRSLVTRRETHLPFEQAVQVWNAYSESLWCSLSGFPHIVTHTDSYFYDAQTELKRVLDFLEIDRTPEQIVEASQTVRADLNRSNPADLTRAARELPEQTQRLYREFEARCGPVYERAVSDREFQARFKVDSVEKALERITRLEDMLSGRSAELNLERAESVSRHQAVEALDKAVKRQLKDLIHQSQEINRRNEEIFRQGTEIHNQRTRIYAMDLEIQRIRDEVSKEHDARVTAEEQWGLTEELRAIAEQQRDQLRAEIDAIRNTRWWRLHDRFAKLMRVFARHPK